jgi:hypothetical protein
MSLVPAGSPLEEDEELDDEEAPLLELDELDAPPSAAGCAAGAGSSSLHAVASGAMDTAREMTSNARWRMNMDDS